MKVIESISTYLQKNDYVKIPNLGCFEYNNRITLLGEIEKKVLSFNFNDREKDTSLIDYISLEYQCSRNESLKLVFEFVHDVKYQLKKNIPVSVGHLGCLFKEKEEIVFYPFLESSDANKKILPKENQKREKKEYFGLILTLFLICFSVIIIDYIINKNTEKIYKDNKIENINQNTEEIGVSVDEVSNFVKDIDPIESNYTVREEEKVTLDLNQYLSQNGTIVYRNQIIAGSFQVKDNAYKKLKEREFDIKKRIITV